MSEISRREIGRLSIGAGVAVMVASQAAAETPVAESDVQVKTSDGTCDAAFFHPKTGTHPGVLIWPDAFGLRPAFRDMGRRLAAEGYAVLVPNPYYRVGKAPQGFGLKFDVPADREKLTGLMASLTGPAVETDAKAYVAFLDSQSAVNKTAKIGATGYCMGGRLVMITAATVPERLQAGASFHGGGLVTDKPESPHLLVPKLKGRFYFGVAQNDDQRQPDAKDKLKEAFANAHIPADIEVYDGALHGWCIADMPEIDGKPIYNQAKAEIAWGHLLKLFKESLAA